MGELLAYSDFSAPHNLLLKMFTFAHPPRPSNSAEDITQPQPAMSNSNFFIWSNQHAHSPYSYLKKPNPAGLFSLTFSLSWNAQSKVWWLHFRLVLLICSVLPAPKPQNLYPHLQIDLGFLSFSTRSKIRLLQTEGKLLICLQENYGIGCSSFPMLYKYKQLCWNLWRKVLIKGYFLTLQNKFAWFNFLFIYLTQKRINLLK